MARTEFDIVIVGAGLIGTSLACALAHSGLKIALLEHHLLDLSRSPSLQSRPISLSYGSQQLLQKLAVWPSLQEHSSAIEQVQISEQGAFGRLNIKASDYDLSALGYVLPFDCLRQGLYRQALENQQTTLLPISRLIRVVQQQKYTEVVVLCHRQIQTLRCALLIGADGSQSLTRQLLGIASKTIRTRDVALTATLTLSRSIHTAYERFTQQGVFALLPRNGQQAGLVWTFDQARRQRIESWSDQKLLAYIQGIFANLPGLIQHIQRASVYELIMHRAALPYQQHAVLVGNAAHTLYPIAAQGFNLGLRDALQLANVISYAKKQTHLRDKRLLPTYFKLRAKDQKRIQHMVSLTAYGVDLDIFGLKLWRGLGLFMVDLVKPIKAALVKRALGFSGAVRTVRGFIDV